MSYGNPEAQHPHLGATFVPGGFDDYYMPAPQPELVSPSPQRWANPQTTENEELLLTLVFSCRIMPEVPENMQDNIEHLELEADYSHDRSVPTTHAHNSQSYTQNAPQPSRQQAAPSNRQSQYYEGFTNNLQDLPNFSPFPRLVDPPQNVPPTYEEKEVILEQARVPVLNSNDPEMQLAWAQDALAYVQIALQDEERTSDLDKRPRRPSTPAIEHQLKADAMNIVDFLAQQHHPKAEFMKGMWLEFGNFGVRQDKREAFRCYARAAEKGYSRAEYRMGMQFEQNNDPAKALHHYKLGAEAGDGASNYVGFLGEMLTARSLLTGLQRLGMMTLMGQNGETQDPGRGIQMLRIAAEHADENAPQGAYVLGMLYARELPQVQVPEILLPFDLQHARMNIEKAAYLGFPKAQVKMGSAYELCSLGCDFNPALSIHYNALAARQGEPEAEMAISKWFLCGHDGLFKKNEELAYVYASRAAQSSLPTAEFAMGYFSEIGLHVPVDLKKATEWYEKAAKQGNEDAKSRLEGLKKQQQLSMKDHENVAINRIKSQYGSRRGGRPPRFKQSEAPPLPSVKDENEDRPSVQQAATSRPPRHSSMTPYPESDGPPKISQPERPATIAPYPVDDRPPRISGPPSFGGGFAPELRAQSAVYGQRPVSDGGFGINPDIYNQGPPNGRLGPQHAAAMNLPLRPATTEYPPSGAAGRGGRPPNQRLTSGPQGMPANPRPQSAQPKLPPQQPGNPAPPPKIDIGYSAPGPAGRGQWPPQQGNAPPGLSDIGYVAPLAPRKSSAPDGRASRPPEQPGGGANGGAQPHPQRASSRPSSADPPQRRPDPRLSAGPPAAPPGQPRPLKSPGLPPKGAPGAAPPPQKPAAAGGKTAGAPKPEPHGALAPVRPHGSGPKTFEEMGVPKQKDENECVVM